MKTTVAVILLLYTLSSTCEDEYNYNYNSNQLAIVARSVVHRADFAAVNAIRHIYGIVAVPFVSLVSISDGPPGESTGQIYAMIQPNLSPSNDIADGWEVSMMISMAQTRFCKEHKLDPVHPMCFRVTLNGKLRKIEYTTTEHNKALNAILARHEYVFNIPKYDRYKIYFARMDIESIVVFANYEFIQVTTEEYYAVNETVLANYHDSDAPAIKMTYKRRNYF